MRKLSALAIVFVLAACSFDPIEDPTPNGVFVVSSDSALMGTWISNDTSGGHTYWNRLTVSSKFWYERTIFDSLQTGTTQSMSLYEKGTWVWWSKTPGDSSHIVLNPSYRMMNTLQSNLPDTVLWTRSGDTLKWTLPKWNQRNDTDTIRWLRN